MTFSAMCIERRPRRNWCLRLSIRVASIIVFVLTFFIVRTRTTFDVDN